MTPLTHCAIDARLCGHPVEISPGRCTVELLLLPEMRADERGLVHGGFVFGAADYAAMLAVNEPTVVLGAAEVRFSQPCTVGEVLRFEARVESAERRKRRVLVQARNAAGVDVFSGTFTGLVPELHVLGP